MTSSSSFSTSQPSMSPISNDSIEWAAEKLLCLRALAAPSSSGSSGGSLENRVTVITGKRPFSSVQNEQPFNIMELVRHCYPPGIRVSGRVSNEMISGKLMGFNKQWGIVKQDNGENLSVVFSKLSGLPKAQIEGAFVLFRPYKDNMELHPATVKRVDPSTGKVVIKPIGNQMERKPFFNNFFILPDGPQDPILQRIPQKTVILPNGQNSRIYYCG